mgnify:FL=1|tara:strand:- start:1351 stop:1791 length:441 start_codon:yes stop_codon:yes gene_type:complete
MLFFKTKIKTSTVDKIINIININKDKFSNVSNDTYTENGFQSSNIVNFFNEDLKKDILDNQCLYQDIFHLHYIEYGKLGFQKEHHHSSSEEYSFILYLNDSVGDTIFPHTRISPEKGLLVIFDSSLLHRAEESVNKKILVGAIKKK